MISYSRTEQATDWKCEVRACLLLGDYLESNRQFTLTRITLNSLHAIDLIRVK